ncbi:MAG: hypothetical protein RL017_269, partial [Pseudomonadota bacterium]|jgi:hypothetical protein
MNKRRILTKVVGFFTNLLQPKDKTKSNEVSHSLHAKPINSNNKFTNNKTSRVKSVGANKNANKTQASRQQQQRSPQSQRYDNISKSDTLGNNKTFNRNNLRPNNRSSLASAPANENNLKVTAPKIEEMTPTNLSTNQSYAKPPINQAWGENPLPVAQPKIVENEILVANTPVEENKQQFIPTAEVLTIVKQNTIMQPVDLGEFELVATDLQLKNNYQPAVNIDSSRPRYNDVVASSVARHEELEYELVETKVK